MGGEGPVAPAARPRRARARRARVRRAQARRAQARVFGLDLALPHARGALDIAELVTALHPESKVLLGGLPAVALPREPGHRWSRLRGHDDTAVAQPRRLEPPRAPAPHIGRRGGDPAGVASGTGGGDGS